jgi:hypothetical protein
MPIQQIYPVNPRLQSEIPLWLKFRCFEYIGFFGRLANAGAETNGVSPSPPNLLSTIYVPAPVTLVSGISNKYNENPAKTIFDSLVNIATIGAGIVDASVKSKTLGIADPGFANKVRGAGAVAGSLVNILYTASSYFTGVVPPDFNDNTYAGTNKRTFKFSLVLPCLTEEDASSAASIARLFESYSIPSVRPGSLFYNHPPMWGFGVGEGTGPFIDNTWLSNPQLCSLASVAVNRSAPDSGTYALLTSFGLKPTVFTISLEFIEIEPIYRSRYSLDILSRSQAFAQSTISGVFG